MSPNLETAPLCCLCSEQGRNRLGVAVPALVVPVLNYPVPLYLRFRGALCQEHRSSFTLNTFAQHFGPEWYELAADHLRAVKKPAVNPYPNDASFTANWESFIINPNFEPAPKEQCYVQFWAVGSLAAKAAHQTLGRNRRLQ